MLSPEMLKSQITISGVGGWGGVGGQLLMLIPEMLKSQIPISGMGGMGVSRNQFPKVNFKFSKSSPELKFPFEWGWGGGFGGWQKPISKSHVQIF